MTERYDEAYSGWYTSFGRPFRIQQAIELFRVIHSVEGIEVVEESDFTAAQRDYDDAHYAFGKRMLEPWAAPGFKLPNEFTYEPLEFLKAYRYRIKARPSAGDVVAYSYDSDPEASTSAALVFPHYGIVNADGTITSKFGIGNVLQHPLDRVPSTCGNFAYFLGRTALE